MEQLTSLANGAVKWAAALVKEKKNRATQGLFVCEGDKLVAQALAVGCKPHTLFFDGSAYALAPDFAIGFERVYSVARPLLQKICAVRTAPDMVGVFYLPPAPQISNNATRLVALDGLQDPANVGGILRTALALGFHGVLAGGDTAELFSPRVLRASMGAVLCLPVVQTASLAQSLNDVKQEGFTLYATMLRPDAKPIHQVSFAKKSALVIGNEGHGISQQIADLCDHSVIIPMAPAVGEMQSLNAAAAAAIALWEANRPT